MKRILLSMSVMVMCGAMSVAQTDTRPSSTDKTEHKAHAKMKGDMSGEKTLTGCVAQEGTENEFMLKTGSKRNIELESTEDLRAHVGHTVKVTGTWDMEADKAEMKGGADAMDHKDMAGDHKGMAGKEGAEHKGMKEHHFKVTKMEMVSETCKMGAGKAKAEKKSAPTGN